MLINSLAERGVVYDTPLKDKEIQTYYGKAATVFAIHRLLYVQILGYRD